MLTFQKMNQIMVQEDDIFKKSWLFILGDFISIIHENHRYLNHFSILFILTFIFIICIDLLSYLFL